jgi:hypothetical protein
LLSPRNPCGAHKVLDFYDDVQVFINMTIRITSIMSSSDQISPEAISATDFPPGVTKSLDGSISDRQLLLHNFKRSCASLIASTGESFFACCLLKKEKRGVQGNRLPRISDHRRRYLAGLGNGAFGALIFPCRSDGLREILSANKRA